MLDDVLRYFLEDPLRVVYLVGGSGGIWFWVSQWRNRVRLSARLTGRVIDQHSSGKMLVDLEFEIENVGGSPTSLAEYISFSAYTLSDGPLCAKIPVDSKDRNLAPFQPKRFEVQMEIPPRYMFSWYHTYTVHATKGGDAKVRFLNSGKRTIGALKFHCGLLAFRVFNYVPSTKAA